MKPTLKSIVTIFLIATNYVHAEEIVEEPFGIHIGQPAEELRNTFNKLIDYEDSTEGIVYFKKFPKPYRDFDLNFTQQSKSHGVCLISSVKDGLTNTYSATDILSLFKRISDDVTSKYKKPSSTQSTISTNDSISTIQSESKYLRREWKPKSKTIDKIVLSISFNDTTKKSGIASLTFAGKNYTKCSNEIQENRSANL